MKQLIFCFLAFWALLNKANAQVDSFYWDNTALPHTLYAKIHVGQGNQLKYIDQFFNLDTLFLDIIFTDCSAPTTGYMWDSLISIPSSVGTSQYHFVARYALDSNSIANNNCFIHPRWYDTIFTYFMPVGVNDYERTKLKELRARPNPVVSKLQLDGLDANDVTVGIYSCTGQLVSRKQYDQFLDVSALTPGVYFFRVENVAGYKPGWFRKE